MTMSLQQLLTLFVAMFSLFSPLSNIGPFATLVGHFSRPDQKKLAFTVFRNVLFVMLLFVWVGELLFNVLGVNESSLSVTGGNRHHACSNLPFPVRQLIAKFDPAQRPVITSYSIHYTKLYELVGQVMPGIRIPVEQEDAEVHAQ